MTDFCRICLGFEHPLHNLYNTNLQQTWEIITNAKVDSDSLIEVCYICAAELKRCSNFMKRCFKNYSLLQEVSRTEVLSMVKTHADIALCMQFDKIAVSNLDLCLHAMHKAADDESCLFVGVTTMDVMKSTNIIKDLLKQYGTQPILVISNINYFDIIISETGKLENENHSKEIHIKNEVQLHVESNKEVEVKNEKEFEGKEVKTENGNCDVNSPCQLSDNIDNCTTDSEDEIPLMKIALNKTNNQIKKEAKIGKIAKYKKKKVKLKAEIITLTHEEQLQEMTARSKSTNYINSPYKCDMCFKGFINVKAFEHHMLKHDEKHGQFECELCHLRYSENKTLRAHVLDSHARIYKCRLCDNTTRTLDHAREHQNWHNGYMFSCQLCGMQYQKSSSYFTHLRKSHPMKHECNVCGEKFVSTHGLAMHDRRTHRFEREQNNEPNSKCEICGIEMKKAMLKAHMETHETKKRVKCLECGNTFKNRTTLQMHCKNKHLGRIISKNIVCETCGKVYSSKTSLIHHQRTHNGEKPYACTVCNKRFAMKWNLTIHFRMHSGDRPYQCEICNKKFAQKAPLTRHYRVHTGAKPYTCQLCSRAFSQSTSLKFHINTVHLNLPSGYKRKKSAPKTKTENTENIEVEFKINDEK